MSLPRGWTRGGRFVCRDCSTDEDRAGMRCDDRVASGKECAVCRKLMPYEASVRLLPDGFHSIHAPRTIPGGDKIVLLERSERTLIDRSALVYVSIGCSREVGVTVTPNGKVEIWIHDEPYGDADEPSARWTYDPHEMQNGEVSS